MRLLRIAGLVIFLLSAAAFAGYRKLEADSKDLSGPIITYNSNSITVSVNTSKEELLKDVTAYDEKDGVVTDSLLIEEVSKFDNTGKRTITYAAFDSNRNITKAERELIYSDYIPPRFSLSNPLRFIVGDTSDILRNITAQDVIDGDLTENIKYEIQKIGFGQKDGKFDIEFMVTNSAGDTAYLPAKIEFYYPNYQRESFTPEILLSQYVIYAKVGETVDAKSYLKGVILGEKEFNFLGNETYKVGETNISKSEIKVNSNINKNQPGVYTIVYSISTAEGYTGSIELLVVFEE